MFDGRSSRDRRWYPCGHSGELWTVASDSITATSPIREAFSFWTHTTGLATDTAAGDAAAPTAVHVPDIATPIQLFVAAVVVIDAAAAAAATDPDNAILQGWRLGERALSLVAGGE